MVVDEADVHGVELERRGYGAGINIRENVNENRKIIGTRKGERTPAFVAHKNTVEMNDVKSLSV